MFLLTFALAGSGCISAATPAQHVPAARSSYVSDAASVQKVEVIHFHTDQFCESCEIVGELSEDTVRTGYPTDLASGKIVYMHINVDDPANRNFVEKYGATGSSLWTGVYDKTGFHPQEDLKVWYLIGDKVAFSSHLKGVIDSRLSDELD